MARSPCCTPRRPDTPVSECACSCSAPTVRPSSTAKKDADAAAGAYGGGANQADRYAVEAPSGVDATQFSYGHVRQYFDLLDAIDEGREPLLTVEQALLALAAVRAVYISAVLGRKVRIDDVIAGDYDDLVLEVPSIEVPTA